MYFLNATYLQKMKNRECECFILTRGHRSVGVCCGCCLSWPLNSRGTSYRVWVTALVKTQKHEHTECGETQRPGDQWPLKINCYKKWYRTVKMHEVTLALLLTCSLFQQQQFCFFLFKVLFILLLFLIVLPT